MRDRFKGRISLPFSSCSLLFGFYSEPCWPFNHTLRIATALDDTSSSVLDICRDDGWEPLPVAPLRTPYFFFNLRDNYLVARLDPYTFVYIARKIITIVCTAVSVWCWTGVSQQVKRTKRCRRAATPDSRCSQSATVTWNFDNKDRDTEVVRKAGKTLPDDIHME